MHPFCRFCASPAEKIISLEELGFERLQKWALLNLGLELTLCPGFSTSVCWACVTTLQCWAGMLKARAKCVGDEHLANQQSWWDELRANRRDDDCVVETVCSPAKPITPSVKEAVEQAQYALPEELVPKIEAIHTSVDLKLCKIQLTALDHDFIKRSCLGLVNLSALPPNFPDQINLKCKMCKWVAKTEHSMKAHNASMHQDLKSCPTCLKTFKPATNLYKHLSERTCNINAQKVVLKFLCPKCPETSPDFSLLADHFKKKHSGKSLTDWTQPCWICSNVYFEKRQLMDHFKHAHQDLPCRHCNSQFKSNVGLMTHLASCHQELKFMACYKSCPGSSPMCLICHAKFPEKAQVANHFLKFHSELLTLLENPDEVKEMAGMLEKEGSKNTDTRKAKDPNAETAGKDQIQQSKAAGGQKRKYKQRSHLTKRYACPLCHMYFYALRHLKAHLKTTTCARESRQYTDPVETHLLSTGNSSTGRLSTSDNAGQTLEQLIPNFEEVTPGKIASDNSSTTVNKQVEKISWVCKWCPEGVSLCNRYSLVRHTRLVHPKVYSCRNCMQIVVGAKSGKCDKHQGIASGKVTDGGGSSAQKSGTSLDSRSRRSMHFKRLRCPKCKLTLPNETKYISHFEKCNRQFTHVDHSTPTLHHSVCKICGITFPKRNLYVSHMKTHKRQISESPSARCDPAKAKKSKVTASAAEMQLNAENEYNSVKKRIEQSLQQINPSAEIIESSYKCPLCSEMRESLEVLEAHASVMHPLSFRFVCRLCPADKKEKFLLQTSLSKHIQRAHSADPTQVMLITEEEKGVPEADSRSPAEIMAKTTAAASHKKEEFLLQMSLSKHVQRARSADPTQLMWITEEEKGVPEADSRNPAEITDTTTAAAITCAREHAYALDPAHKVKKLVVQNKGSTSERILPPPDQTIVFKIEMPDPRELPVSESVSDFIMHCDVSEDTISSPNSPAAEEPSEEPPLEKCSLCDVRFIRPELKRLHMWSFHNTPEPAQLLFCLHCNKSCRTNFGFHRHSLVCKGSQNKQEKEEKQTEKLPYVCVLSCNYCQMEFSERHVFENHLFKAHDVSFADKRFGPNCKISPVRAVQVPSLITGDKEMC